MNGDPSSGGRSIDRGEGDLAQPCGFTVAGQRRNLTGLRYSTASPDTSLRCALRTLAGSGRTTTSWVWGLGSAISNKGNGCHLLA